MDAVTKQMVEDLDAIIKSAKAIVETKYNVTAAETVRSATFTKATVIEMMAKVPDKAKEVPEGEDAGGDTDR